MAACNILFHVCAFLQVKPRPQLVLAAAEPDRPGRCNGPLAALPITGSGCIRRPDRRRHWGRPAHTAAAPCASSPACATNCPRHEIVLLLPIVQVLLAIAIIVVVAVQLVDVGVDGTSYSYSCLLGQDYLSTSLCTYTFVVCGVSLVVSSLISIIQCCTCNLCGLGKILDVLVGAAYA